VITVCSIPSAGHDIAGAVLPGSCLGNDLGDFVDLGGEEPPERLLPGVDLGN